HSFGSYGVIIAGIASLFVCLAPTIAYTGAASRLTYSLAITGYAPTTLARLSVRYATPVGGLAFLSLCFVIILGFYSTGLLPLTTLIQIPNATFILTYLGGCAAGIVLLRDSRLGILVSGISLVLSVVVFLFVSWAVLYPMLITVAWIGYQKLSKKGIFRPE
ncbi:MAG: amino acid permease, partial [Methanomicrobiales archaeon HGW-Methanomicrobiales-4]